MQVQNNSDFYNTNFKSIKSIKKRGFYSIYPKLAEKINSALEQNPTAKDFFKKYDADIVISMERDNFNPYLNIDDYKSSLKIFYDYPSANKVKSFLKRIFGLKNYIEIFSKGFFDYCTEDLIKQILPPNAKKLSDKQGVLSGKMQEIDGSLVK